MSREEIVSILKEKVLKVTPQRVAVLEALQGCSGRHPSAEEITDIVRRKNSNIAVGTIYKVLEALVENDIIKKVYTDKDIMRYDVMTSQHHHLYSEHSGRIEDYYDEELNRMLNEYFSNHRIPGFRIDDIQIHIEGEFSDRN